MTALFQADRHFDVPSRRAIVIQGTVIAGTIRPGMELAIPWSEQQELVVRVAAVEEIDEREGGPTGLVVEYATTAERRLWQRLDLAGRVLESVPRAEG